MSPLLFWIFAAVMIGFGVAVVVNRSPVASALSLVVSFLGLSALFISLDAYFIGIIQVLVYAGAVMVLFLFIIMLLDLKAEQRRRLNPIGVAGGGLVSLAFVAQVFYAVANLPGGDRPFPQLVDKVDDVHDLGVTLFTQYNLPLQIVAVLVLVASVGVVVLSKRELK